MIERAGATLGERLARTAARRRDSLGPRLPWRRLLEPVLARTVTGPAHVERFRRVESPLLDSPIASRATAEAEPLSPDVRERLRPLVGTAADALRVHRNDGADRLAADHHSDAVTVGRDVHFRGGRFRPLEPEGFALLAHEASHVAEALRPDAGARRAAAPLRAAEERAALALEQTMLSTPFAPLPPSTMPVAAGRAESAPLQPMAADADRALVRNPRVQAAPFDATELRRELHRELLDQIRTDFERGG